MEKHCRVELLAPAGNAAGFYGAVHAGADAVYLAGNRFGARAYAENFSTEELLECIRYGHLLGRKIYLTVNTLLKNQEMNQLYEYLAPFYEAGLDAVIVQDLGVLRFIQTQFPGLKIHVSTQMTICAGWGASLLQDMGASRIVPARELSLDELVAMRRHSGMEIETFVHGAMCYCYSGQCLFSSILGGRSGNRGRCAQPCRLPYSVVGTGGTGSKECYPLSLKDMCTIEHIPQLVEAGIDSFKIEGRMKRPEYAAGVTNIYRRCIDRYYELRNRLNPQEAAKSYHVSREDQRALASLYVRSGLQDGYYFKHGGRDMIAIDNPAYRESDEELLAGIREKYLDSHLKLPVTVSVCFHVGRPAKVTYGYGEISASAESEPVERAMKQPVTEENVRKQLCRLGDSAFYAEKTEISMDSDCFYPLKQMNELRRRAVAELERRILQEYESQQTGRAEAETDWNARVGTSAQAGISAPAGMSAQAVMTSPVGTSAPAGMSDAAAVSDSPEKCSDRKAAERSYAFYVRTLEQLRALGDWIAENPLDLPWRIYVDGNLLIEAWPETEALCRKLIRISPGGTSFAAFPYILRETDRDYLETLYTKVKKSGIFQGFLVRSMDGLGFLREMEKEDSTEEEYSIEEEHSRRMALSCRTDAGVYVWNDSAAAELSALADGFCLPYELNASAQRQLCERLEQKSLTKKLSCEKIIYSRIPMMITANCLRGTQGECGKGPEIVSLKDRYRKEFPVLTNCLHCMNIIYNSVPFSLHMELGHSMETRQPKETGHSAQMEHPKESVKWKERVDLRMDFTLESPEEVRRLLDAFFKGAAFPMKDYTTGHEKRGAE